MSSMLVLAPSSLWVQVSAIAELVLASKITCTATGEYAYGCGNTWAGVMIGLHLQDAV